MGNQNSGNKRKDYRRGRHPQDAEITAYNKEKVGFVVRVHPELLKQFRVLAIERNTNATALVSDFIKRMVARAEKEPE